MTVISFVAGALAFLLSLGQPAQTQRFDYLVRGDVFAGMAGDEPRLERAKQLCERTLAENPKHAEALVWLGSITLFEAGRAFVRGDAAAGGQLFARGVQEMNDAVGLAPDNPGVLIPRAATLIEATRTMAPEAGRPLLESAVANYEHVLELQQRVWPTLGDHAKGELLFGLAEASARLGRADRARAYFERLIKDAPSSGQAPRAQAWLDTGTIPKASGVAGCTGCHK
ncbi:MAG TPA: tetratricopeptide repeat protein [Vicinamibacterales bacterium]|nr:tetratricopeptide repeat protein [Vicinamibacterales bacterium]